MRRSRPFLLLLLLAIACNRDATGPSARPVEVALLGGDLQYGLTGGLLEDPIQVVVHYAGTTSPAEDVDVTWTVVEGSGQLTSGTSTTDVRGIATTQLRLGSSLGSYVVEARAERQEGAAVRFTARAIERPVLQAISPQAASSGQTVVITGTNFSPEAAHNVVLFDGVRGSVTSASSTRLDVVVPACVPTRTVNVQVLLGPVASTGLALSATGSQATPLALQAGEARTFTDAASIACVRLAGGISAARYLIVPQNVAGVYSAEMPFQLTTRLGGGPVTQLGAPPAAATFADAFELRLRSRERDLVGAAAQLRHELNLLQKQVVAEPKVGDRRSFKVLDPSDKPVSISAEIKYVTEHAIFYQDLDAPANGFQASDFVHFGDMFERAIHPTTTKAFGDPSDIDANGRVIILFTPRINALSPRGQSSYIAGYFYGCDLVAKSRCAETNTGEIFYAFVPDPEGKFGDRRNVNTVSRSVLPVMAHELQHMINFSQRDETLDALWLSEALAHTAEELVAWQLLNGLKEELLYIDFMRPNQIRAARFLSVISSTSMIAEEEPGTIELRGAGWVLLRYLRAHYGGDELLRKLSRSQLEGTQNVAAQTGRTWAALMSEFAVALYADRSPDVNVAIDPKLTFGDLPVRYLVASETSTYPLATQIFNFGESAVAAELGSSATAMFVLNTPTTTSYGPLSLMFTGRNGAAFGAIGKPQLTIFRIR